MSELPSKQWCIAAAVLLAGCVPDPTMQMREQTANAHVASVEDSNRVVVTRIGVFRDDLAYNNRRGVYLVRDTETGREFLGVSGVGITEVGRHTCGKGCTAEDER